jgi:hypothetical protein
VLKKLRLCVRFFSFFYSGFGKIPIYAAKKIYAAIKKKTKKKVRKKNKKKKVKKKLKN